MYGSRKIVPTDTRLVKEDVIAPGERFSPHAPVDELQII